MSSSVRCVAVLVIVAGCSIDRPPILEIDATAGTSIRLEPFDVAPQDDVHYHWQLVEAPAGSVAASPDGEQSTASFTPDFRGQYLVERWIVVGLSEDLTHEIIVTAAGVPPVATLSASATAVSTGMTVNLDGAASKSLEHRPLRYRWKLASHPADSRAQPSSLDALQIQFGPDVAGSYVVELAVYDGELWSTNTSSVSILAFAP